MSREAFYSLKGSCIDMLSFIIQRLGGNRPRLLPRDCRARSQMIEHGRNYDNKNVSISWSPRQHDCSRVPSQESQTEGEVPEVRGQKDALPSPPLAGNRSPGRQWLPLWVPPTSASWMSTLPFWPGSSRATFRPPGLRTPSFGDCGCTAFFWPS